MLSQVSSSATDAAPATVPLAGDDFGRGELAGGGWYNFLFGRFVRPDDGSGDAAAPDVPAAGTDSPHFTRLMSYTSVRLWSPVPTDMVLQ